MSVTVTWKHAVDDIVFKTLESSPGSSIIAVNNAALSEWTGKDEIVANYVVGHVSAESGYTIEIHLISFWSDGGIFIDR